MSSEPNLWREARLAALERRIDPENRLPANERRKRAEAADEERFRAMGRRSGEERRKRAALLASLTQSALAKAISEEAVA